MTDAEQSAAASRIVPLDLIRGVAVMGILSVNVIAFAMIEGAYFNPAARGGASGADLVVWAANMVLIDGKMRALFSMLFGASMVVVIDRAEAAGERGWTVHRRRMVVLAGFGLAHYFLLWFGDILLLYALTGLIAFGYRRLSPERLAGMAAAMLALSMVVMAMLVPMIAGYDGGAFAPDAAAIAADRALMLGGWSGLVGHKLADWTAILPGNTFTLPETLGLMLLGMAALRSGFLTGAWRDTSYRRVAAIGLPVGLAAHGVTVWLDLAHHFAVPWLLGLLMVAMVPFRAVMALGIAALLILLARDVGPLARRIAATGRMALSNYLASSVVGCGVFYGWGLGWYDQVSRAQAWLLAPLLWLAMLAWSKPWLDHFHYGPMEWLWRSLSRGAPQPMRRRRAAAVTL